MSEDKAQQEPSMEDILASIRRILSEDEAEDKPKAPEPPPPEPEPEPMPPPEPEPEPEPEPVAFAQDDIDSLFDTPAPAPEPEPEPMPIPEPEPEMDDDILELTEDMVMEEAPSEPEPAFDINDFKPDLGSFDPEPEPEPYIPPPPPPRRVPMDDSGLMAQPNIDHGASLLSNLAREIVRQKAFGLGNSAVTLEDLVNELLRPILKEWLDQNLPYMIERIVKKEIERMVNRSEDY
ncbi:hypothetical protein A6A04_09355 [Paramagnetospirillum marisnigri]|uniref:Pole-organizing protein PopZ n=1 Tax=Paramagnetospirillum marisnigri TaxID=1285242 RepID=A0A178M5N2_9PROT|nr:DUF2497 domain-containing protein [Paramagnetospirillum marisnigri]OAN44070.1 hypothetical protein A6A04_09355 [Paramagnetospirillum marisnigri]